ncbi:MAG TPA: hypothetical protein VGI81_12655 [Tepidisphaeraceae bacterium]|jgi:hypothetical protein
MKFDFAKILDVSKRYWVIIACCVVMLIAVIAIPVFVSGQADALQKQLAVRKKTADDVNAVLNKARHQPVVTLDADATAPPLTVFPNEKVIEAGENAIKGVQAQSVQLKSMATQFNSHPLLVPGSLPVPRDPYQFQQAYLKQFTIEIPKALNAATPPTEDEIKYQEDLETKKMTEAMPHNQVTGEVFAKELLDQRISDMLAKKPEQMRKDAAEQHKIYMAPSALALQPQLAPPAAGAPQVMPDAEQIWLAQMGLWVQQDVVKAIIDLNQPAKNVGDAIVKELVQIYVPSDRTMYVVPGAANGAPAPAAGPNGVAPSPIPASTDTDAFPKDFNISPTGRVSNGVFDVVAFDVVMNVQAKDVERVIQEMERNRLITVNQSEVAVVNSALQQQQGYYFGPEPVVTLTLKCEELFMRDWTRQWMPASIKQYLNAELPQGAPGAPTASAQ